MKKILFFAFFCCAFFSYAQKADLKNCYKYSEENLKKYYHSLSVFPSWISGTDMFWYNYITPGGAKYYLVDPVRKKKLEMFDMEDMIGKLTQATGISFNIKDFRLGGLKFDEGDPYCFSFSKGGLDFHYNIRTRELKKLDPEQACRFYLIG